MGELVERMSTNDKSEVGKPQQQCFLLTFYSAWRMSLRKISPTILKMPLVENVGLLKSPI
jgi:hypothetical protein